MLSLRAWVSPISALGLSYLMKAAPPSRFSFLSKARREKQRSHKAEQPGLSNLTPAQRLRAHSARCILIRRCVLHVRINAPHYIERHNPSKQIGVECCQNCEELHNCVSGAEAVLKMAPPPLRSRFSPPSYFGKRNANSRGWAIRFEWFHTNTALAFHSPHSSLICQRCFHYESVSLSLLRSRFPFFNEGGPASPALAFLPPPSYLGKETANSRVWAIKLEWIYAGTAPAFHSPRRSLIRQRKSLYLALLRSRLAFFNDQ